jgi:hypothetical protein
LSELPAIDTIADRRSPERITTMVIALNGAAHVNFVGTLNQQTVMTGFWFQAMSAGQDLGDLAQSVETTLLAGIQSASSPDVIYQEVVASDPLRDGEATHHRQIPGGAPGTLVGVTLPGQNTVKTRLTTGFKSGRRRGAALFPGIIAAGVTAGRVTGNQLSAINDFYATALAQYGPGGIVTGWRWVTYSPENLTSSPPRPGIVITPITSHSTDNLVRTIHRRQIAVGI